MPGCSMSMFRDLPLVLAVKVGESAQFAPAELAGCSITHGHRE